ncbi:MAG: nickel pincer cofactor biosynthesis protein LarB [Planctomycetales bacterium]|nr:nickel pincer cofactor biosynthesis protein LarB [Planctomycetales bacterium]
MAELARALAAGQLSWSDFLARAAPLHSAVTTDATVDLDRRRRCGYPEVIYGAGKAPEALVEIATALHEAGQPVLVTRVDDERAAALQARFVEGRHDPVGRTWRWDGDFAAPRGGRAAVVSAGTSDEPVAREAAETLDWMGVETNRLVDVGVAGPHRLPARVGELSDCDAVVVAAGMEGALPSVVGGYLSCPVVAVPTSVGYGAAFGGLAALLGMLNSCSANVTVVNIDAGFKAGFVAGLIARRAAGYDAATRPRLPDDRGRS